MSKTLRTQFGQRVRELRHTIGLSQEAFADKCGLARSYMSRVERGTGNPSIDAIEVLAVALGVEVKTLFETTDTGCPPPMTKPPTISVPFASDGSCFNPTLRDVKTGTFAVGEKGKGKTIHFDSFDAALNHLKQMKVAKWWRPSEKGREGLVSAVEWKPLPKKYSR